MRRPPAAPQPDTGGTAAIRRPPSIVLFVQGRTGAGVFMLVWGVLVVGTADNIIRPLFVSGRAPRVVPARIASYRPALTRVRTRASSWIK